LLCITALGLASGGLRAGTITNLDTGQSPGVVNTASDPIWKILSAPFGNTSGPAVLIGDPIWGAAPAGSHWIATDPAPADSGGSQYSAGTYRYAATFLGDSGILSFAVKADNAVSVFLNGNPLLNWGDPGGVLPTGWATFSPLQTVTSGFQAVNTLELDVENNGTYTGALLEGGFTAAPEPATWPLLLAGLALVVCSRWKARKSLLL
jgi:hypothetical protein